MSQSCTWPTYCPVHIFENRASGYLASLNDPVQHKADSELLINSLANDASAFEKAEQFYFDMTQALIKQKSFTLSGSAGYSVNLVVLNLIPVHFAATAIAGLLLKTETTLRGIYMEHELQQMLRDVFSYIFFEVGEVKKMRRNILQGCTLKSSWVTSRPMFRTSDRLNIAVMSYGPGTPPLSLQGPYEVMLSGTPRIVFIPLDVGHQTKLLRKHSSLTMKASLEFTPRHNTSRPFFPFLHDCIYPLFTDIIWARCSPT
ncbi:hypothetical protein BU17DRAFT_101069 [Hysterangium stoloniferum]|nr:hypothetical protein BU17DRAFT_101069 [Hysterangium stoloniferum]